jgi:predicted site-specific integrase-resolvase
MDKIYSMSEAAEYLGVSIHTISKYLHREGILKPDGQVGKAYFYRKETLDKLRVEMERRRRGLYADKAGQRMYTQAQAGRYLEMSRGTIYYMVRSGKLVPDAHRKGRPLFYEETLEAFRASREASD